MMITIRKQSFLIVLIGLMFTPDLLFAQRQTIRTASGQAVIATSQNRNGSGHAILKEKSFTMTSMIDGTVFNTGLQGIRFADGTGISTNHGLLFARRPDVFASCGGGGQTTNPGDCRYTRNNTSHITLETAFIKDGLDYFTIYLDALDQRFEIPACGTGLTLTAAGDELKRDADVVEQIRSVSPPRSTVALTHPLSARDEDLAAFESLPRSRYVQLGETSLRVLAFGANAGYEFVRKAHGIEVYEVYGIQSSDALALIVGVLPSDVSLADIQVGLAYATDPFNPDAILIKDYSFIRVELNGNVHLLNRVNFYGRHFTIGGTLGNIRFAPVARGSSNDRQIVTNADAVNIQSHQCFIQAFVY